MPQKPTIFVTRRMPDAVTQRLTADYEARLNAHDGVLSAEQLASGAEGADALLVTPTDKLTAEVIGKLPKSVRMIATFSVGYEHIDLNAAKARGAAGLQHAGRADRRDRRYRAAADAGRRAPGL